MMQSMSVSDQLGMKVMMDCKMEAETCMGMLDIEDVDDMSEEQGQKMLQCVISKVQSDKCLNTVTAFSKAMDCGKEKNEVIRKCMGAGKPGGDDGKGGDDKMP